MLDALINVVLMLGVLVVLVVSHEFGHFVMARRAGVTVHEFGIGLPPRIRTIGHLFGTPITLNALPLGGFVRLEGEDAVAPVGGVAAEPDPHSFAAQPLGTRIGILLAGVVVNGILAILLFAVLALTANPSVVTRVGGFSGDDSPAKAAGLRSDVLAADGATILQPIGDTILAVDGHRFAWYDGPEAMLTYIRSHAGQSVSLSIRHADGTEATVAVTLRDPAGAAAKGALGIHPVILPGTAISVGPIEALGLGVQRAATTSTEVFAALGNLISDLAHPQVTGPIGIAEAVGQTRQEGAPPGSFLFLIALLTANLAVLNVLPIPPMDGGRIATALLRAGGGARFGVAFERRVAVIGFVMLVALIVWIGANDIGRLGG